MIVGNVARSLDRWLIQSGGLVINNLEESLERGPRHLTGEAIAKAIFQLTFLPARPRTPYSSWNEYMAQSLCLARLTKLSLIALRYSLLGIRVSTILSFNFKAKPFAIAVRMRRMYGPNGSAPRCGVPKKKIPTVEAIIR